MRDGGCEQRSVSRALTHIDIDEQQRIAIDGTLRIVGLHKTVACGHDARFIVREIDLRVWIYGARWAFGLRTTRLLAALTLSRIAFGQLSFICRLLSGNTLLLANSTSA